MQVFIDSRLLPARSVSGPQLAFQEAFEPV